MPTYEYRCPKGHDFEKFYRSISTAPVEVHCPECGALAVRQLSGGSLVFKGSGFYITDYGKDGKKDQKKPAEKTESGSAAASDAGAAPAADAKPAVSSEPKPAGAKQDTKPAAAPAATKPKDKK
jgi:putative FmdB family regulatory protein